MQRVLNNVILDKDTPRDIREQLRNSFIGFVLGGTFGSYRAAKDTGTTAKEKTAPRFRFIDEPELQQQSIQDAYKAVVTQNKGVTIPDEVLSRYVTISKDPAKKLLAAVKDYYTSTYKGNSVDVSVDGGVLTIRFENDGKKKSVGWRMSPEKASTFEYLDKMFEEAKYAYSEVNRHEGEEVSVPQFHYFVTNVNLNGRNIPVKLQVRDIYNSAGEMETRYYTHNTIDRENDCPSGTTQGNIIAGNAHTPSIDPTIAKRHWPVNIQFAQSTAAQPQTVPGTNITYTLDERSGEPEIKFSKPLDKMTPEEFERVLEMAESGGLQLE